MPEGKGAAETLYGNKEGESNTVRMKFLANPMPTEGQWNIGEVTVPIGASDLEGNFQSSQITETGVSWKTDVLYFAYSELFLLFAQILGSEDINQSDCKVN